MQLTARRDHFRRILRYAHRSPRCLDSFPARDGAGGAIIAWQDFRNPPSKIAVQHILASGNRDTATWPFFGRALVTDPATLVDAVDGQAARSSPGRTAAAL